MYFMRPEALWLVLVFPVAILAMRKHRVQLRFIASVLTLLTGVIFSLSQPSFDSDTEIKVVKVKSIDELRVVARRETHHNPFKKTIIYFDDSKAEKRVGKMDVNWVPGCIVIGTEPTQVLSLDARLRVSPPAIIVPTLLAAFASIALLKPYKKSKP